MTLSSSIGPIRVSFFGLTTTQQQQQQQQLQPQQATHSLDAPTMPMHRKRQMVSRNLFGSIAPGESDGLLKAENQRQRHKFRTRYNFDIATGEPLRTAIDHQAPNQCVTTLATNVSDADDAASADGHPMNLLEREQADHLNSLKFDKHVENLLVTPPQSCAGNRRCVSKVGFMKPQNKPTDGRTPPHLLTATATASSLLASERHKPYARQLKLTEFFNERKPVKCHRNDDSNVLGGPSEVRVGNSDALENEDQSTRAVLTRCVNSCQAPEGEEVDDNNTDLPSVVTRVQAAADANDDDFGGEQANSEATLQQQHVEVAITATTHKTLASSSSATAPSSSHLCAQRQQAPS